MVYWSGDLRRYRAHYDVIEMNSVRLVQDLGPLLLSEYSYQSKIRTWINNYTTQNTGI